MFALDETVSAKNALDWGLANRVVPLEQVGDVAADLAAKLARQPVGALATTKRLMRKADVLAAQIASESECFAERLKTAEAREAFTAFAERRPPDFMKLAS
jgi:enoyl-CoA hydratase/carnithine racemase